MKSRTPTREMVWLEMMQGPTTSGGPWAWALYAVAAVLFMAPNLVLLSRGPGDEFAIVLEVWQAMLVFAWLGVFSSGWAFILVREAWSIVPQASIPAYNVDEFLLSRAIDRRQRFRIKTLVGLVTIVGPLVAAGILGFLRPEYVHPGSQSIVRQS